MTIPHLYVAVSCFFMLRMKGEVLKLTLLRSALILFNQMETRVAVMSIIVEDPERVDSLNGILHEYGDFIIGRMGIPYRKRKINIISIALDAPQNTISALSGKIGSLPGVSVKTAYSGVISNE